MNDVSENSLVLVDELGKGTEPMAGTASFLHPLSYHLYSATQNIASCVVIGKFQSLTIYRSFDDFEVRQLLPNFYSEQLDIKGGLNLATNNAFFVGLCLSSAFAACAGTAIAAAFLKFLHSKQCRGLFAT